MAYARAEFPRLSGFAVKPENLFHVFYSSIAQWALPTSAAIITHRELNKVKETGFTEWGHDISEKFTILIRVIKKGNLFLIQQIINHLLNHEIELAFVKEFGPMGTRGMLSQDIVYTPDSINQSFQIDFGKIIVAFKNATQHHFPEATITRTAKGMATSVAKNKPTPTKALLLLGEMDTNVEIKMTLFLHGKTSKYQQVHFTRFSKKLTNEEGILSGEVEKFEEEEVTPQLIFHIETSEVKDKIPVPIINQASIRKISNFAETLVAELNAQE